MMRFRLLPILVKDWRNAHRWHSVQASFVGALFSSAAAAAAMATSAGNLAGVVPFWAICALFAVIFIAALLGRLISQAPEDKS